jgi:hypothetical protein
MAGPLKQALSGKSDAGQAGYRPQRDGVKETAMATKDDDTKAAAGFKSASEKLKEATTVRDVESLLQLHNDEQTTREINGDWRELRRVVDGDASKYDKTVKGRLTITIDYEADSDTGKKEITISRSLKLPDPPKNTKVLYEDADGALQTIKPSKQTEMFENVTPIRKGV